MLSEIYCDKFHQKRITFKEGLNVVLGTERGDNSIGKSTLLLIVDFVYGGSTYCSSEDIIKNVGDHTIFFKFKFGSKTYYFARSLSDTKCVWRCDRHYSKISSIDLGEYCKWLAQETNFTLPGLSFRDGAGRFMRVYNKNNCDEKQPLLSHPKEKSISAIDSLIKLFDSYSAIESFIERAELSSEKYNVFSDAQKYEYIVKIKEQEYEKNLKAIEELKAEYSMLSKQIENSLIDADLKTTEEALRLKEILSSLTRERNLARNQLKIIEKNEQYEFSRTTNSFESLSEFFTNANIKHLEEIESFHKKIVSIFKNELKTEKENLVKEVSNYNQRIEMIENRIKEMVNNPNISNTVLRRYAEIVKDIERMQNENKAYDTFKLLSKTRKDDKEAVIQKRKEQLNKIKKIINEKMESINSELYDDNNNPPILDFSDSNYSFVTPNDTGTGIAYKGLVVFDLSIASLTRLPLLIHDSILLKQISDNAVERIINQYIKCGKQVVIAFDKQSSYSKKTAELLERYSVIELSPNGGELFGRSWSNKDAQAF